jgi:hypothetical protein
MTIEVERYWSFCKTPPTPVLIYGLNKAIVRCWPEGLCVANTGVPFSGAGVESLLISNLSPKKLDRSRHIGNRGLGFRSILAWTNSPFILSGNLRLAFSPILVSRQLEHAMQKGADLRARVLEWRDNGDQTPMPILACPAVLNEQGEGPGFQAENVSFSTAEPGNQCCQSDVCCNLIMGNQHVAPGLAAIALCMG